VNINHGHRNNNNNNNDDDDDDDDDVRDHGGVSFFSSSEL
jgi:hypothetical protein